MGSALLLCYGVGQLINGFLGNRIDAKIHGIRRACRHGTHDNYVPVLYLSSRWYFNVGCMRIFLLDALGIDV